MKVWPQMSLNEALFYNHRSHTPQQYFFQDIFLNVEKVFEIYRQTTLPLNKRLPQIVFQIYIPQAYEPTRYVQ